MQDNSSTDSPASGPNERFISIVRSIALGAAVAIVVLIILLIVKPGHHDQAADQPSTPSETEPNQPSEPESPTEDPETPTFINLQPAVNAWLSTTSAKVGLMIYDLDNHRIAAAYQPNQTFNVASIYKLFYAYAVYRQIEAGAINPDSHFATTTDYKAGKYTLAQCLDLMIRESYNGCADPIRSNRNFSNRTAELIDELGLKNTTDLGLVSTAADLTKLLELYYYHSDFSETTWAKIADSMLNQPPTTYDWRQGLPAGFSNRAKVYDKVGWEWDDEKWNIYADAAIVEFPELNRHYTVVVLTSGITDKTPRPLINLGSRLEAAIFAGDNNS